MSKDSKILLGILAVTVGGLIAIFALANQPAKTDTSNKTDKQSLLVRSDSHKTGTGTKVTLVEFADYQCPACGTFNPTLKKLTSDYSNRITVVFRNFPLDMHKNSKPAAEAAEAAGEQGKFWEMHDKIYENQAAWSENGSAIDIFAGYAKDLGLDVDKFKQAVSSNKFADFISKDLADATSLELQGTPTVFLNGDQLQSTDISSYDNLKAKVDEALKK